jgi:uncharacterized protein (TIGR03437 family)
MRGLRIFALATVISTCAIAQIPVIRTDGGIVNGASFDPSEPITPGSLITIFGSELASQVAQADSIPLATELGGVRVNFVTPTGTIAAPMLFTLNDTPGRPSQLNIQVPWDLVPAGNGTVDVVVVRNGQSSAAGHATVGQFSPAIFASNGRAVAVNNVDGTLAWPVGAVQGLATHPAKPGDALILYANGLGAILEGAPVNGAASTDLLRHTATTPQALVGGMSARVLFSGLAPQFVGVNQVNIVVPDNAPVGDAVPIQLSVGGITSTDQVTIAITR